MTARTPYPVDLLVLLKVTYFTCANNVVIRQKNLSGALLRVNHCNVVIRTGETFRCLPLRSVKGSSLHELSNLTGFTASAVRIIKKL